MVDLVLPLKGEYFDAIKAGEKLEEYRLANEYWTKRLIGQDGAHRTFGRIVLTKGYPKREDSERRLTCRWKGFCLKTLTHPHFGADPVTVYAIDVSEIIDTAMEDKIIGWLLKMQIRDLNRDGSYGFRSAHLIGEAVGLTKKEARRMADDLVAQGRIRLVDTANYRGFMSNNPLPWEKPV